MSDPHFLRELIIVLTATIAIVFVFQKLRLPTIVGFLLTGVIIGPHGFQLIQSVDQVENLAEIGVVLLLFTIGLEFSLETILSVQRRVVWAGLLQVVLTTLVVLAVARLLGASVEVGLFYGFLVSLSSTAIVLRIYHDRGEINSLQGRLASGLLLFQDLCVVPMMLLLPVLAGSGQDSIFLIVWVLAKSLITLVVIVWTARKLLPRLLHQVALLRNREIFVLFVVLVCFGTAWLTSESGLSLALGALVAGLVISESELSHQIVADILPLRDCFSGIFFISSRDAVKSRYFVPRLSHCFIGAAADDRHQKLGALCRLLVVISFRSTRSRAGLRFGSNRRVFIRSRQGGYQF